ncbi:MAG: hypothetical protein AAFR83_15615 [Cyanobacteria bacterium J06629_18]
MGLNQRQVAAELNVSIEQVRDAVKTLFSPIPPEFSAAQVNQIREHLERPQQKQLSQTNSLTNSQNSGKVSTNDQAENLNIFSQERTEKRIKRLYEAGSMVGKSEAQAFNSARNDAFMKEVQADDGRVFYDFINGAIQHTIHNSHFSRNVDRLNGRKEVQEVQIERFEQPTDDSLKYLIESEDDALARGWAKLLNPGQ